MGRNFLRKRKYKKPIRCITSSSYENSYKNALYLFTLYFIYLYYLFHWVIIFHLFTYNGDQRRLQGYHYKNQDGTDSRVDILAVMIDLL